MPPTEPPEIRFAATGPQLYLAISRRATHEVSLVAETLLSEFLARQPRHPEVVLDLAGCDLIDSTFAGWMLKTRRRLGDLEGRPVLSGCSDACQSTLKVMGLTSFFAAEHVTPPEKTRSITCTDVEEDSAEAIQLMLEAHEDLSNASPENKEKFSPVTDLLRRELNKKKRS